MKLIDEEAFIDDIKTEAVELYLNGLKGTPRNYRDLYEIIDRIGEQPTVDAVEVVRCKDCKHKPTCKHTRSLGINGYCSDGEREETT